MVLFYWLSHPQTSYLIHIYIYKPLASIAGSHTNFKMFFLHLHTKASKTQHLTQQKDLHPCSNTFVWDYISGLFDVLGQQKYQALKSSPGLRVCVASQIYYGFNL